MAMADSWWSKTCSKAPMHDALNQHWPASLQANAPWQWDIGLNPPTNLAFVPAKAWKR
jgi:hypothetical protein